MAASALPPALRGLAVSSVAALRARLPRRGPLLGLDITPTHVGAALSDGDRTTAAPFGALARSAPALDARTLRLALAAPATQPALSRRVGAADALDSADDPTAAIVPAALVVGVPPAAAAAADVAAYVADLVGAWPEPFPGLAAVLFLEEADVVRRVLPAVDDYAAAMAFVGGDAAGAAGGGGGGGGGGAGGGAGGAAPRPRYLERRWAKGRAAQLRPRRILTGAPRVAAANRISASELVEVVLAELRVSAAREAAGGQGAG